MPQVFPLLIPQAATGALSSILHESRVRSLFFVVPVVAVFGVSSLLSLVISLSLRPLIPFGVRGSDRFLQIPLRRRV